MYITQDRVGHFWLEPAASMERRDRLAEPGRAVKQVCPGQERDEIRSGRGAGPFVVRRPTLHGVVFAILCLLSPEHRMCRAGADGESVQLQPIML
jgi:hypothetical protein